MGSQRRIKYASDGWTIHYRKMQTDDPEAQLILDGNKLPFEEFHGRNSEVFRNDLNHNGNCMRAEIPNNLRRECREDLGNTEYRSLEFILYLSRFRQRNLRLFGLCDKAP